VTFDEFRETLAAASPPHRKDGDLPNARYWYRQAGQAEATQALGDEWTKIVAELLSRR
jgi:hypothetical protein